MWVSRLVPAFLTSWGCVGLRGIGEPPKVLGELGMWQGKRANETWVVVNMQVKSFVLQNKNAEFQAQPYTLALRKENLAPLERFGIDIDGSRVPASLGN